MIKFQLESWSALAPGLDSQDTWRQWLNDAQFIDELLGKVPLKQIPPLLRRRFSTLGKCAMGAALPLLIENEALPSIFASRHGDTPLTLSLLEEMGRGEPMSPTGFSLAVHNAVSGLFSIARKDTCETTTVVAMEALVVHALLEAVGQLQDHERVLCVIYDVPLPDFYRNYCDGDAFPYAIALVLSRTKGDGYYLEQNESLQQVATSLPQGLDSEPLRLLEVLTGLSAQMLVDLNGSYWRIAKA